MDFFKINIKEVKGDDLPTMYPDFIVGRSKDLMVRGKGFYAIWDEERQIWSTDEYDVQRLVDEAMQIYADDLRVKAGEQYNIKFMRSASAGSWYQFRKYVQNLSDNSQQLDETLTFSNTEVKKSDYVSRRLPYPLAPGDYSAWDELIGTLYNVEERAKIEWAIGAVASGDAKKIQKFLVLYGPAGTGKSTVLNIVEKLFTGYTTYFEAKKLGSMNAAFAMEVFKNNPLVAIQHDGDLSKIEDNTTLNQIVAHEDMTINEKYKSGYTSRVNAFLFMGTNQPVKISDAKSGLIRRLIDVHPTGVKIPENHYHTLMSQIEFELGAIVSHCLGVYHELGKNYYSSYRPLEMMLQTDIFFNFIEANFDIFKAQDNTSLKQAYSMYKEFCNETGIDRMLPQYKFREELRNYFDEFKERGVIDGVHVRSFYTGFNANKFKMPTQEANVYSLVMDETVSIFDELYSEQPAQYATSTETPIEKWEKVTSTLAGIDTSTLHFVKVPTQHIVIDFDLKDENGEKSLERNLEAASVWPATYAELSKGGAGVHLHYDYAGDVSRLSGSYSDGIEVKTLLGGASLRRRLSRCNNIPVAPLAPGKLPEKEAPLKHGSVMKSEETLRNMIAKNLDKGYVPGTKSSIDFIKKILDDATEQGMVYDVIDLRPRILNFAMKSSNKSLESIKVVQQMKFTNQPSDEGVAAIQDKVAEWQATDERLVFYDVEVYPNLFIICWKFKGDDASMVRMINPTKEQVEELLKLKLVGFYNRRYDNHILYAAMLGYNNLSLYNQSQSIVSNRRDGLFGEAYGLSYTDVWDFAAIKMTLKKWEIELGIKHVELNIPWDKPVDLSNQALVDKIVEYCCSDVDATEAVFNARYQDFVARQILADLSGLTVNDTTQRHTARIVFGNDRDANSQFHWTDLREEFPGYKFELGKSTYRGIDVGEGGWVDAEYGVHYDVIEMDIASMHPTTIEVLNCFGPYTKNFSALKEARLAIKHGDYESARAMMNGRLKPFLEDETGAKALADALKIVINIVYGLTSASFPNAFTIPGNVDNVVAKRGALFMIELKMACVERGMKVVHIKTDSIKIANGTQEDIDFITNFGSKYGYTFEHEATYEKFCLTTDADYVAYDAKRDVWDVKGKSFAHPYVFKTLFSHEPIEFKDLCEPRSVVKGAIYLDYKGNKEVDEMVFVGKTGSFVPVLPGNGGAKMYRVAEVELEDGLMATKAYAVAATTGFEWIPADHATSMDEGLLDMSYFQERVDEAFDAIAKYDNVSNFLN